MDGLFSHFIPDDVIRFSAKVLTALCDQVEGIPISGLVVVGDGQAARSMALSGNAMKVPVLWAKGGSAQLHSGGSEVSEKCFPCLNPYLLLVNKHFTSSLIERRKVKTKA